MLDYSQMKQPGFYWLSDLARLQQPQVGSAPPAWSWPEMKTIVEIRGAPAGAQLVYFIGKSEPVKLEDLEGELVGPLNPHFVTCQEEVQGAR